MNGFTSRHLSISRHAALLLLIQVGIFLCGFQTGVLIHPFLFCRSKDLIKVSRYVEVTYITNCTLEIVKNMQSNSTLFSFISFVVMNLPKKVTDTY